MDYTYQPDGKGGVNYFRNGVPITNAEYAQATGKDTTSIEQMAAETYAWNKYNVGSPVQGDPTQLPRQLDTQSAMAAVSNKDLGLTTGGGTTSSAAVEKLAPIIYNGRQYDPNTAEGRLAYYNDVNNTLTSQRDAAIKQANDNWSTATEASKLQYARYLSEIDQQLQDNQTAAKDFTTQYGKTVNDFTQQKGMADVNRRNTFSGLGANAFQSAQATSQGLADQNYTQGIGDLAKQGQEAVGVNYLTTGDMSQLGGKYGQTAAQLGENRNSTVNAFTDYQKNLFNTTQNSIGSATNAYNTAAANQAESLGQYDVAAGLSPFQYNAPKVESYKPQSFDTSQYANAFTAGTLQNTPTNNAGGGYKSSFTPANYTNQQQLDSWMGKFTPNQDSATKQQLYKYVLGQ